MGNAGSSADQVRRSWSYLDDRGMHVVHLRHGAFWAVPLGYARLDFKFQLLSSATADVYSGDKTILLGDKNPVVVAEMSGSVLDVENVSLSCTDGPRNLVRNSAVP